MVDLKKKSYKSCVKSCTTITCFIMTDVTVLNSFYFCFYFVSS